MDVMEKHVPIVKVWKLVFRGRVNMGSRVPKMLKVVKDMMIVLSSNDVSKGIMSPREFAFRDSEIGTLIVEMRIVVK